MSNIPDRSTPDDDKEIFQILQKLAYEVERRRMQQPAVMFLEMYKPLTGIAHTLVAMSYPIIVPLFGAGLARSALRILESPESVERLICLIENSFERSFPSNECS